MKARAYESAIRVIRFYCHTKSDPILRAGKFPSGSNFGEYSLMVAPKHLVNWQYVLIDSVFYEANVVIIL